MVSNHPQGETPEPESLEKRDAKSQITPPPEEQLSGREITQAKLTYVEDSIKDLMPAAEKDTASLHQTEQTFQAEFPEPPVDFTGGAKTAVELKKLQRDEVALREHLKQPPQDKQPNQENLRPPIPQENPVEVKANAPQMAELLQQNIDTSMTKIYQELQSGRVASVRETTGAVELRQVFTGSHEVSDADVNRNLESLQKKIDQEQQTHGGRPITLARLQELGRESFREETERAAAEPPARVERSQREKQTEEVGASHQPGEKEKPAGTRPTDQNPDKLRPGA